MRRTRQKRKAEEEEEKEPLESKSPPKKKKLAKKEKPKSSKDLDSVTDDNDNMRSRIVMRLQEVVRAKVVNRPSKVVRSPYMADIIVDGTPGEVLCHSPALGCAGLIVPGSNVLVTPKKAANADTKSKYSLDLVDVGTSIVGVNPMMCNKMVRTALERGLVKGLPAFTKDEIKAEVTVEESRFDFRCTRDGIVYYVEVKGVPCACIEDSPISPKKKALMMDTINKAENKIAYFPDGYRKSGEEVISPRALKHTQHLTRLVRERDTVCVLLFVVQRSDCISFQPTKNDPAYREAVYLASEAGVKILAQTVIWNSEGSASWDNTLPINLRDSQDLF